MISLARSVSACASSSRPCDCSNSASLLSESTIFLCSKPYAVSLIESERWYKGSAASSLPCRTSNPATSSSASATLGWSQPICISQMLTIRPLISEQRAKSSCRKLMLVAASTFALSRSPWPWSAASAVAESPARWRSSSAATAAAACRLAASLPASSFASSLMLFWSSPPPPPRALSSSSLAKSFSTSATSGWLGPRADSVMERACMYASSAARTRPHRRSTSARRLSKLATRMLFTLSEPSNEKDLRPPDALLSVQHLCVAGSSASSLLVTMFHDELALATRLHRSSASAWRPCSQRTRASWHRVTHTAGPPGPIAASRTRTTSSSAAAATSWWPRAQFAVASHSLASKVASWSGPWRRPRIAATRSNMGAAHDGCSRRTCS
mmetsp:Transcript_28226/g.53746  ORF Transcript_28226/g.53746 Transcript_28226/m.53746 type:complete len:384 (-) Transcript_28226:1006-2157(-)